MFKVVKTGKKTGENFCSIHVCRGIDVFSSQERMEENDHEAYICVSNPFFVSLIDFSVLGLPKSVYPRGSCSLQKTWY